MANLSLGVDIGGTFTDHVLYDEETGRVHTLKTPSTPEDLSLCVLEGIRRFAADRSGSDLNLSVFGVAMVPGWTEFARIPYFAYSTAVHLVSIRTAPFRAL